MCRCRPYVLTPWCPECCEHEATHFLEKPWPTGEGIEVCELCLMSRQHYGEDLGTSEWVMVEDLDEARRQLEEAIAGPPRPSLIRYECDCGHVMLVSVPKIDQDRDETRPCDKCGAEVAWDEFTVDGRGDTTWT